MTKEEELRIIERIKCGEERLYEELVKRHSASIFNLIRGVLSNREEAEEVAQDVFVKAFFSIRNFRGECSFSTWLYRIAYNMAISKARGKKRVFISIDCGNFQIASEEESGIETKNEKEIRFNILNKALIQLDSKDKFLILSFYLYEKSIKELAEISGLSESNVKVRLHRSKKRLSNILYENREVSYG